MESLDTCSVEDVPVLPHHQRQPYNLLGKVSLQSEEQLL